MATRRALVLVGGAPAEMPVGDTLVGAGGAWTTVPKTTDESRTASATLTADSALVVAGLAVGTYLIRIVAWFSTANATMDLKYDTNFTGTATYRTRFQRHVAAGAVAGTDAETTTIGTGAVPSTGVAATTTGIARVEIELVLNVTVAGNFQFRWAQNTSDAGALICQEGSLLEYTPV